MACFGEYEIVTEEITVAFPEGVHYATYTVAAPANKRVLYGWTVGIVPASQSHPSSDGSEWEFELYSQFPESTPVPITLCVTCARLD